MISHTEDPMRTRKAFGAGKSILQGGFVLLAATTCLAALADDASLALVNSDRSSSVCAADRKSKGGSILKGHVGARADAVFARRLTCEKARGDIFNEAVNAFVTKMDDLHPCPPGVTNHNGW